MALTDEEQRAREHRAQERRRRAYKAAQEAAMAGDANKRAQLEDDWAPLADRDRREV